MILRGIDFGVVHGASGVQGFFGEGYWFHRLGHPFGLDFNKVTLVAKTGTFDANKGNMALKPDFTPAERFPDCIRWNAQTGATLNSVGLSNPGYPALLATGKWQALTNSFFLSFMAIRKSRDERMEEYKSFVRFLKAKLPRFQAKIGLQVNFTCPNTGHDLENLLREANDALDVLAVLNIPIVPKLNTDLPVHEAKRIAEHPACDALCISNALPWASLPDTIRVSEFGSTKSPLQKYGGGGYSGEYLYNKVYAWIRYARLAEINKPLVAGGGIRTWRQAVELKTIAGPNSAVFLGSMAMTRGWRVRQTTWRISSHIAEREEEPFPVSVH